MEKLLIARTEHIVASNSSAERKKRRKKGSAETTIAFCVYRKRKLQRREEAYIEGKAVLNQLYFISLDRIWKYFRRTLNNSAIKISVQRTIKIYIFFFCIYCWTAKRQTWLPLYTLYFYMKTAYSDSPGKKVRSNDKRKIFSERKWDTTLRKCSNKSGNKNLRLSPRTLEDVETLGFL